MSVNATTEAGAPINNFTGSLTVGEGGPIVLQDINFLGRMQHALRERIPERFVHAKGAGATGKFVVTQNMITKHCKAKLFSEVGKSTNCMVRMSTVGGERGSSDNERDARGFAVKFYTEEGIWDLLSLSTPVFFIRDPTLFPHLIHCQKRNPQSNLKDPNSFWDFMTEREETVHMLMMIFADRGIPDGYEHMNGYSGNTFTMVNKEGGIVYVRFKWKTNQKVKNITNPKDPKLNEPDYSTKKLFDNIEKKNYAKWTLQYQFMTKEQAEMKYQKIAFDVTKVWPHADFPLYEIGTLTLNANPNNYFAEVEQVAFSPSRLVPGIQSSPDQLLQGRIFAYNDTQMHRLGVNYNQLPRNRPQGLYPPHNYERDGPQTIIVPGASEVNYYPNSFKGPKPVEQDAIYPITIKAGTVIKRYDTGDSENFTQAKTFYNDILMDDQKARLAYNIADSLFGADTNLQTKAVTMFRKVSAELSTAINKELSKLEMTYISDITFITSVSPVSGVPEIINVDMNSGSGGRYIYPLPHFSDKNDAIAGLKFIHSDVVSPDIPDGYTKINQDLNDGAGGTYNYLCYTKKGKSKMTAINFIASDKALSEETINGYFRFDANLNAGTTKVGKYVYLLYKTNTGNPFE